MIRTLLVDDEIPARTRLSRILKEMADVEIVGEASDGKEALIEIDRLNPDLVLLDIEMPELDGLEVASALSGKGPAIVFITAYDEHALKAFELSAIDYLVKPPTQARVEAALAKIRNRSNPKIDLSTFLKNFPTERIHRLAVKCGAKYVIFDPRKISAIVAKDHYSAITVEGRELLADDPLDVITERLNSDSFIRIHRSAVINVDYLGELEREGDRKYTAVMSDQNKTRVPVSRERLNELKERLGLF